MKIYLIEEGKAYEISGDKAYEIVFSADGSMKTLEDKSIDIEGKERFSFYELERKLNLQDMFTEEQITEDVVQAVATAIADEAKEQEKTVEEVVNEIVEETTEKKSKK